MDLGPSGSGKSRLAIDLASHFPVEIINADSMQVYRGLDVLTNKVSPKDQNGVPHHLFGTVSPDVEFTAKYFQDSAIPSTMGAFKQLMPVQQFSIEKICTCKKYEVEFNKATQSLTYTATILIAQKRDALKRLIRNGSTKTICSP
ncbi:tRNA dimethylallyltransferase 2-like isoform X1 [Benincasa hispida]|uniref:tRNA dimethylallyltransferase 2-like isoform X1 n=1 Tax=Benincasa hispida TaxID=102211 RepID=UPI001901E3AF|nr:tRNA dimethylallyltransferase 2-like isoform X1 [Benincasa hispida]